MTTTEQPDLHPAAPPSSRSRSTRRTVLVIVLLLIAVGALLSQGLLKSLNYFVTVDEAWTQRPHLGTSTLRLEGVVEPGTIERTSTGASFYIEGSGTHRYFVTAAGSPPQLFQANIPVVVVGHFASSSSPDFLGSQIMVKHSSTYIAQHPGRVKAPNGTVR